MRTTDIFGVLGRRRLGQADADPAYTALPAFDAAAPPTSGMWKSTDAQGRKTVVMRAMNCTPEGVCSSCFTDYPYDDWVKQGRVNICGQGSGQPPPPPAQTSVPVPVPAPGAPPTIPGAPPSGCNIPAGYGPDTSGNAPAGKAVYACLQPDGTYNVFNQADNSPVMSQVSVACLSGFAGVNLLPPWDPRCGGAPPPGGPVPPAQPPSVISNPGAAPLTYPIQNMWFPESLEAPPIQPIGGAAPAPPMPTAAPPPPPMPKYAPGQPIPVTDWFGICVQKARGL